MRIFKHPTNFCEQAQTPEKKKAELTQKSRKEIADYISGGKVERARIRVEYIIREDYLVEAMEVVEMYCDLLLARFGLITQMKELDDGIAEAVCSLVWVAPRLQNDVSELKIISEIFIKKYGPNFGEHCRTVTGDHRVSEKLMHKLSIQAPPKLLVEKYMIEIAKNYNIEYEADPQIMKSDQKEEDEDGFHWISSSSTLPQMPDPPSYKPFNYPPPSGGGGGGGAAQAAQGGPSAPQPFNYNIPPNVSNEKKDLNINTDFLAAEGASNIPPVSTNKESPDDNAQTAPPPDPFESLPPRYSTVVTNNNLQANDKPKPQPRAKIPDPAPRPMPNLPNVPLDLPDIPNDDEEKKDDDELDFDELNRRFQALKKGK
uniref:IST1 homolog n=1 Tax=Megaselia scalaris TaxID=36166 RepID=T1GCY4_MEGSC